MLGELRGARGPEPTGPDGLGSVPPRPPAPPPPLPLPANPWDEAVATAARTLHRIFGVRPPGPLAPQPPLHQNGAAEGGPRRGAARPSTASAAAAGPAAPDARVTRRRGRGAGPGQGEEEPQEAERRRSRGRWLVILLVAAAAGAVAGMVSSPLGLAAVAGAGSPGLVRVVAWGCGARLGHADAWPSLDGRSALHYAVDLGWGAAARSLMEAGADPNRANTRTELAPLVSAAAAGRAELVAQLLRAGADPEAADKAGRSALEYAVEGGDVRSVRALLAAGAWTQGTGLRLPPLVAAILAGEHEIAELLLKHGANPNTPDLRDGDTPLLTAIRTGSERAVRALLKAGADFDRGNNVGETPLYRAAAYGHAGIVTALIEKGANPDLVFMYFSQRSPLHIAANYGRGDVVRVLTNAKVLITTDEFGRGPLHLAAARGQATVIRTLAAAGVPVNGLDDALRTPLIVAAAHRPDPWQAGVVRELIAAGANVNLRDATNTTALGWAVRFNASAEVVRALAKAGADTEARDKDGKSPLHWALAMQLDALTHVLLPYRPKGAAPLGQAAGATLLRFVREGDLLWTQALVDEGADTEAADEKGLTPLHRAAKAGNTRAAAVLLKGGASPAATDKDGWTPLHYAMHSQSEGTLLLLMRAGAPLGAKNKAGKTAIELSSNEFAQRVTTLAERLRDARLTAEALRARGHDVSLSLEDLIDGVVSYDSTDDDDGDGDGWVLGGGGGWTGWGDGGDDDDGWGGGEGCTACAFCCPWTGELLLNPVVTADGYTFERGPIEDWLRENRISPCTGAPLPSRDVRPNLALRSSLDDWLRANRLTEEGVQAMLGELRGARGPEPQPTDPDGLGSAPPRPPAPPPPLPLPANPWDEAVATAARTLHRFFGVRSPGPLAPQPPLQGTADRLRGIPPPPSPQPQPHNGAAEGGPRGAGPSHGGSGPVAKPAVTGPAASSSAGPGAAASGARGARQRGRGTGPGQAAEEMEDEANAGGADRARSHGRLLVLLLVAADRDLDAGTHALHIPCSLFAASKGSIVPLAPTLPSAASPSHPPTMVLQGTVKLAVVGFNLAFFRALTARIAEGSVHRRALLLINAHKTSGHDYDITCETTVVGVSPTSPIMQDLLHKACLDGHPPSINHLIMDAGGPIDGTLVPHVLLHATCPRCLCTADMVPALQRRPLLHDGYCANCTCHRTTKLTDVLVCHLVAPGAVGYGHDAALVSVLPDKVVELWPRDNMRPPYTGSVYTQRVLAQANAIRAHFLIKASTVESVAFSPADAAAMAGPSTAPAGGSPPPAAVPDLLPPKGRPNRKGKKSPAADEDSPSASASGSGTPSEPEPSGSDGSEVVAESSSPSGSEDPTATAAAAKAAAEATAAAAAKASAAAHRAVTKEAGLYAASEPAAVVAKAALAANRAKEIADAAQRAARHAAKRAAQDAQKAAAAAIPAPSPRGQPKRPSAAAAAAAIGGGGGGGGGDGGGGGGGSKGCARGLPRRRCRGRTRR
ncbi:hypothetical protein HYH03_012558 [Edaphochlamys debaryana]|uniref:U-box domain-containing protein n=1 Tax=Edaphochlamys debaryana TaxID=47281 RepID=A0A836BUB8_9CHLO|nr:hypothetical protein HYH03_012558 [Edaphochlamys debaryana]|eukprot:KAG2488937.1 hypothetical protein HYH03_012558 [Edaphochlamys debaryana]